MCLVGAIFLPYFAVVIANVVDSLTTSAEQPEPLALSEHPESRETPQPFNQPGESTLIIVDYPLMTDETTQEATDERKPR